MERPSITRYRRPKPAPQKPKRAPADDLRAALAGLRIPAPEVTVKPSEVTVLQDRAPVETPKELRDLLKVSHETRDAILSLISESASPMTIEVLDRDNQGRIQTIRIERIEQ